MVSSAKNTYKGAEWLEKFKVKEILDSPLRV